MHYYSQCEFTKLFHDAMRDGTIELEITYIHRDNQELQHLTIYGRRLP